MDVAIAKILNRQSYAFPAQCLWRSLCWQFCDLDHAVLGARVSRVQMRAPREIHHHELVCDTMETIAYVPRAHGLLRIAEVRLLLMPWPTVIALSISLPQIC